MMKRIICISLCLFISFVLTGCNLLFPVRRHASSVLTEFDNTSTESGDTSTKPDDTSPETVITSAAGGGWTLVDTQYIVPDIDQDVLGGPVRSTMTGTGAALLDYYQDEGDIGNVMFVHYRTDEAGTLFAKAEWQIIWEAPPAYLPADEKVSFVVEHKPINEMTWTAPVLSASFDVPDLKPGSASAARIKFTQPHGAMGPYKDTREEVYNAKETMTTAVNIPKGNPGDRRAIYIYFGEGYGMRYTYAWG